MGRGQVTALINIEVNTVEALTLIPIGSGSSIALLHHTGLWRAEDVPYGSVDESRLFGIGLDAQLRILWVQDYGRAEAVRILGGTRIANTLEFVLAEGQVETVDAPAVLSLAVADGALGSTVPITDPLGMPSPRAFSRSGAGVALAGTLQTSAGNEAWVARYAGSLLGTPGFRKSFASDIGTAGFEAIALDSVGDLYVQGRSDGPLLDAPAATDAFLLKLSTAEDVDWSRVVSTESVGQPMALNANEELVLATTALEPAAAPIAKPFLPFLDGEDGTDQGRVTFADEEAEPLNASRLCPGADSVTLIGEFAGTLRTSSTVATVENLSIFFYKTDGDESEPIFLRWSSSSVDVALVATGCEAEGGVLAAGTFSEPNESNPSVLEPRLFLLRLSN